MIHIPFFLRIENFVRSKEHTLVIRKKAVSRIQIVPLSLTNFVRGVVSPHFAFGRALSSTTSAWWKLFEEKTISSFGGVGRRRRRVYCAIVLRLLVVVVLHHPASGQVVLFRRVPLPTPVDNDVRRLHSYYNKL